MRPLDSRSARNRAAHRARSRVARHSARLFAERTMRKRERRRGNTTPTHHISLRCDRAPSRRRALYREAPRSQSMRSGRGASGCGVSRQRGTRRLRDVSDLSNGGDVGKSSNQLRSCLHHLHQVITYITPTGGLYSSVMPSSHNSSKTMGTCTMNCTSVKPTTSRAFKPKIPKSGNIQNGLIKLGSASAAL
jgi:hypothetical protein